MTRRPLPLALTVLLLAGCGSTVATTTAGGAAAPGVAGPAAANGLGAAPDAGTGLAAPGVAGVDPVSGTFGGSAGGGGASGPGTVGGGGGGGGGQAPGTGSTPSGSTPAGGASGGSAGASGPGVTAKEIYVGVIYDKNAGAVNSAAGLESISSGDSKANNDAIVKDINKRGGIAGRKLVLKAAGFDSTSAQTLDQQYAGICEQFTQDEPRVFAVLGEGTESYRSCLSKAGVVILSDGLPSVGQAELARYPGFIEQGYANVDRLAAYTVTPLVEQKYFTPWNTATASPAPAGEVKVGIYTYDDKVFSSAVDRFLVPALKRLGYTPLVAKISQVNTAGDYGAQSAAVKSAQLQFAANGVTHVIPFEGNGGLSVFFLANARSQGYYPRYGVNTASASQALLTSGLYESRQFNGAVGYGFFPAVDLPAQFNKDDGPYSNDNRRYCLKVMKDNGITFDSGNAQGIALSSCASLYLLKLTLDKTPAQIVLRTFVAVVEALGASYQKAGGIGQEFRPGRHDPSNKAYHWRFFPDCTCFHYTGTIKTIP